MEGKGFITVATGKEFYYRIAHNLLLSYRLHSLEPLPFAILCDRRNRWTEDFDEVVVIDDPAFSFADKLRIIDLSPFGETIFIDADCLAYRDLNGLWEVFEGAPDFAVLGHAFPLDSDEGWWDLENLGELKGKVSGKITCQGGVYYVRNNGDLIKDFSKTCDFIKERYFDFRFKLFGNKVEDETILTLAAAVHGFLPVRDWSEVFAYYPEAKIIAADVRSGLLVHEWTLRPGVIHDDAFLLHFGSHACKNGWFYNSEALKLIKRPWGISDCTDYLLIWLRCVVNNSKLLKAISNKVPRRFRERLYR
ncbi:MAG: hypothetical protein IJK05_09145 [Bacteroidales bacterium]|nr:hypothetical protein [Bacteroidales bacterium]